MTKPVQLNKKTGLRICLKYLAVGVPVLLLGAAHAEPVLSDVSAMATAVGEATVTATVQGEGEVYAEYAHSAKAGKRCARERYVTAGLLAMWDGVDNQGTGVHDPMAKTWRDLVGQHQDMKFTSEPSVGDSYYDVSAGGGFVAAADIATALNAKNATIEIVCAIHSVVLDGTIIACVDGTTSSSAGNRLAWVRHTSTGLVGAVEYLASSYYAEANVDLSLDSVRSYSFRFGETCEILTNAVAAASIVSRNVQGVAENAYFSIGQRVSMGGQSSSKSDMRVYCVRVYDHRLTDDELRANHAVDVERFMDHANVIDLDNPGNAVVERAFLGSVNPIVSARDFYSTECLVAMWDGEDNQGAGRHVDGVTTWKDLTGNHTDMSFTANPTLDDRSYLLSAGGGGVAAPDIATAINNGAATIEIVCDVRSLKDDGTVFACVDGTGSSAGNRLAWVRSGSATFAAPGVIGSLDYKANEATPSFGYDMTINAVRSYVFKCGSNCVVYKNGDATGKSKSSWGVAGTPENAYFSIGQRVSKGGTSAAISDMRVYCVRVYNRLLSDDEIRAHYEIDVRRFWGDKTEIPIGSVRVSDSDGAQRFFADGRCDFKLYGLRPDVTAYAVRLSGGENSPIKTTAKTFESVSERPSSTWYEYLDSRFEKSGGSLSHEGSFIDLGFVPAGRVPVVSMRYQVLENQSFLDKSSAGYVFGYWNETTSKGTAAGIVKNEGVNSHRYRVAAMAGYADETVGSVFGVNELVLNASEGSTLNGCALSADVAGVADDGEGIGYGLFGRTHRINATDVMIDYVRCRIWNFTLTANGKSVRDLVGACGPDASFGMYDRVSQSFLPNQGSIPFACGPALPVVTVSRPRKSDDSLTLTLMRSGGAESDVYIAYGNRHGGAIPARWEHFAKLDVSFSAGESSLSLAVPMSTVSGTTYVRLLSYVDGWSETIYMNETKVNTGFAVIFR